MTNDFVDMTGKVKVNWKKGRTPKRNTITQSRMVDLKT